MSNPANVVKYQSNPKIMKIIAKVGSAMGNKMPNASAAGGMGGFPGAGGFPGFPGAGPGGFPGFPGAGPGGFPNFTGPQPPPSSNPSKKPDLHDDGLD